MTHPLALSMPLALCALGASLAAQGTISSGNTSYTVGAISATQADSVDSDFSANPAADPDIMWEHWFYYRIDNDPDEIAFANDGTLTQNYGAGHADLDWIDVGQRGLISAQLDLDVVGTSPSTGFLLAQMSITNQSPNPIVLNFYTYLDLDICTAAGNTADGCGATHLVTGSCAAERVEFAAIGADRWCVTAYTASECGITTAGPLTLPNGTLPFGPGDYSAAAQWENRTILPGQTVAFISKIDHGATPTTCNTEASAGNYGAPLGGAGGPPSFVTTSLPELGATATMRIGNALPSTSGVLLIGGARANVQFGNITILVRSFGSTPVMTDAAGVGSFSLDIPCDNPALCGAVLDFQYFYVDPTVAGQLPVAHTSAIEWTLGS